MRPTYYEKYQSGTVEDTYSLLIRTDSKFIMRDIVFMGKFRKQKINTLSVDIVRYRPDEQ